MGLFEWLNGSSNSGQTRMTSAELAQHVQNGQAPVIVDVRERDELKTLPALPGAKNIPLSELEKRFCEIPKDRQVVLICRSGMRSGRALSFLKKQGYTQVQNAEGGMMSIR
jgi:rhodanese-related sulfurtransferase